MKRIVASLTAFLFVACTVMAVKSTDPKHHTAQGFRNNYPTGWERGSFWKWQWDRWRLGLPKTPAEGWHFESEKPDVAWLKVNRSEPVITWVGHATLLLQLGGVNVLTDPHLTERASPLGFAGPKRVVAPALNFHEMPHIDAVVVSHNHYDHLDEGTVKHLARQPGGSPKFFVPLGLRAWFVGKGIRDVVELDWWQSFDHMGLTFTLAPVQHWSARSVWDRNHTLWGGWRVSHPTFSFFFCGDTGYSPDFSDIRERLGEVDLAAIPIGAYEPRWFMKVMHVNPEEAVKIHLDLGARHSVAMHWGTFVLTDEPLNEPPHRLVSAMRAHNIEPEKFWLLKHGETRKLNPYLLSKRDDSREILATAP